MIVLKQLHDILVECAHRFPVPLYGNEGKKVDKFVLTSPPEQLKVVVTLTGDAITHSVRQQTQILCKLMSLTILIISFSYHTVNPALHRTSASVFSGNRM